MSSNLAVSQDIGKSSSFFTSPPSHYALIAFAVAEVAGVILVWVSMTFPINHAGFSASLSSGITLALISGCALLWIAIHSCGNQKRQRNDSQIHLEAIHFARQKLLQLHPAPTHFAAGLCLPGETHQPLNHEISLLATLYAQYDRQAFVQKMKKYPKNPWSHREVIKAADDLMKSAFAISYLTMKELSEFRDNLANKGIERTLELTLKSQDSYVYRTYFFCTTVYHWLRAGAVWESNEDGEGFLIPEEIAPAHAAPFFEPGTKQYEWRILYLNFCNLVKETVDLGKLNEVDSRFIEWIQIDENPASFISFPGPQPT